MDLYLFRGFFVCPSLYQLCVVTIRFNFLNRTIFVYCICRQRRTLRDLAWGRVFGSISERGFRDTAQVDEKAQSEHQAREEEHDLELGAQQPSQFQMHPVYGTQKVAKGTTKTWKAKERERWVEREMSCHSQLITLVPHHAQALPFWGRAPWGDQTA